MPLTTKWSNNYMAMVSPHRPTLPYKVSLFLITPPVAWSINMVRSYLYSVTPGPFWTPPLTLRPSTKGKCLPGWSYMCVLYNAAQFSTALACLIIYVCVSSPPLVNLRRQPGVQDRPTPAKTSSWPNRSFFSWSLKSMHKNIYRCEVNLTSLIHFDIDDSA